MYDDENGWPAQHDIPETGSGDGVDDPDVCDTVIGEAVDVGGRLEDGGGWNSTADWIRHEGKGAAALRGLKDRCVGLVRSWRLEDRVRKGFIKGASEMLSPEEVKEVRRLGQEFVIESGGQASVDIPPGQPFALDLWAAVLNLIGDGDAKLPSILAKGSRRGFSTPLRHAQCTHPKTETES